ncbi:MAG: macB 6 [Planctomycetaceae bacterium]|nr:macB 6 [Planctomycetaceae bacterium]
MRFADVIWNNLRQRPLRSVLTIAGIAFAVASVVTLVSIARGYVRSSEEYYSSRGIDIVVMRAGVAERLTSTLREDYADLLKSVAGVDDVDGSLTEMVSLGDGDLVGIPLHGFRSGGTGISQFTVIEGRGIEPDDHAAVLLGRNLATGLQASPGQKLSIEGTSFTVVGVFQPANAVEGNTAIASLGDLQHLMDRPAQVSEFHIRVKSEVSSEHNLREICQSIEALADPTGQPLGLKALPTRQFVSGSTESKLMTAMAYGTSFIAIGLSLVGILNTVWMSVLERTRDLGILRALGWSRRRVIRMILGEAFSLSACGALFGVIIAKLAIQGLSMIDAARVFVRPELDGLAILIGGLSAVVSGVLGAAYPAWRAASISAAGALRYE